MNTKFDHSQYWFEIKQSIEHPGLFEASVAELPDLVEYADSAIEAFELLVDSIQTTAEVFKEKGRAMPLPIKPDPYIDV